jgi:hypothetical protein
MLQPEMGGVKCSMRQAPEGAVSRGDVTLVDRLKPPEGASFGRCPRPFGRSSDTVEARGVWEAGAEGAVSRVAGGASPSVETQRTG